MKQITVRGVGNNLHKTIKAEADRRGLSMNRYILLILREAAGFHDEEKASNTEYHDLDHLAGTWTSDEFEHFERQLTDQRQVEEELWQ